MIAQSDLVKQVFVLPKHDEEFGHRPVAIIEFHTSFNESAVEFLNVFYKGGWNDLSNQLPTMNSRRI